MFTNITPLILLTLILATWRVTSLLVQEGGPYHIFTRLRTLPYPIGGEGVLTCVWCCSMWTAPIIVLAWFFLGAVGQWIVIMLAVSGGVIFAQETLNWIRGI